MKNPERVDLATVPLADLAKLAAGSATLAAIRRRVFNPAERDKLTVSAFGSAL